MACAQGSLFDFLASERMLSADEVFESASEELIRKLIEDRRFERKPTKFSGSPLGDYVCMFANSSPEGGLIVIGMADKKYGPDAFEGCLALSPTYGFPTATPPRSRGATGASETGTPAAAVVRAIVSNARLQSPAVVLPGWIGR